jgi:cold shock protein
MARPLFKQGLVGTINRFFPESGYGFLQTDDGKTRVFVHITQLLRFGIPAVKNGDRLEFGIQMDRGNRECATNLRLIDNPPPAPPQKTVVTRIKKRRGA